MTATLSPDRTAPRRARPSLALHLALLGLVGAASVAHASPTASGGCDVAAMASRDGYFALPIGDTSMGLPTTPSASVPHGLERFKKVIVPSGMRAQWSTAASASQRSTVFAESSPSGSALVHGSATLAVEKAAWDGGAASILLYTAPTGEAHPVAAVVEDAVHARVSLLQMPLPRASDPQPGLDRARQEHLYTLLLRGDPSARYCIASDGRCAADKQLSQGAALQHLAALRACALAKVPHGERGTVPAWHTVSLRAVDAPTSSPSRVTARASDGRGKPLTGVKIMFTKLPHSACTATTSADGTASCEIVDTEGHGEDHSEFENEPVVATFPGDLQRNPVLLPTTTLIRPRAGGAAQGHRAK